MILKLLSCAGTLACLLVFSSSGVRGELENWEDYPVILTVDYDKAIFLTPETGCYIVEDRRIMEKFLVRKNNVFRANRTTAHDIIMLCQDFQDEKINATQFVVRLHEKSFLIYPGTHFCGVGNNAKDENDLGYYRETDICCREHDACKDSVHGWSCHSLIPQLCNWAPFTRSNCYCDDKFRECLQSTSESAAQTIGTLFFTVFGLKCFRKDYPVLGCAEYGGNTKILSIRFCTDKIGQCPFPLFPLTSLRFLNIHCQKYKYDTSKDPVFQFFDSPRFGFGTRSVAYDSRHPELNFIKSNTTDEMPNATTDLIPPGLCKLSSCDFSFETEFGNKLA